MSKKYVGTGLVALGLVLSVGFAAPAQAASLTSAQVQAVISLLQSFGVDAGTIANVRATLGGSSSVLSCTTFADITYGNFDTDPGGRVSQLQTWLGIPSNTFGFGTYGPKTRALWNSRCGGSTNTNSRVTSTAAFATIDLNSLIINSDKDAVLPVITGSSYNAQILHLVASNRDGKQASGSAAPSASGIWSARLSALPAGAYTLVVTDGNGNTLASGMLQINANTNINIDMQASATIDSGSLTINSDKDAVIPVITGSALNTTMISIVASLNGSKQAAGSGSVNNGRWSVSLGALPAGIYAISIYGDNGALLTTAKLQITTNQSATIDRNSLVVYSAKDAVAPTITGTASNVNNISAVASLNGSKQAAGSGYVNVNGSWSVTLGALPRGTYTVVIYGDNGTLLTTGTLQLNLNGAAY